MKRLTVSVEANDSAINTVLKIVQKLYKKGVVEDKDSDDFPINLAEISDLGVDDFKISGHVRLTDCTAKATIALETFQEETKIIEPKKK